MERYKIINTDDNLRWNSGSPLLLKKTRLLKDNVQNKYLLQLQFENIGRRSIAAVYLKISYKDVVGNHIGEMQYNYLDLNISFHTTFGSDIPVYLTNSEARQFVYTITQVVFTNHELWINEDALQIINKQEKITYVSDIKEQYVRELGKRIRLVFDDIYAPLFDSEYWQCTCGEFNLVENDNCKNCGINKGELVKIYDTEFLKENLEIYLSNQIEEQKLIKEKRDKRNKLIRNLCIIGLGCIITVFMVINVIIPFASDKYTQYQYRNAVETGEEGDYIQAISILEKLGDYEDSEEKVEDFKIRLKYEEAIKLGENGAYEKAIQLFNELNGYANSEELVLQQQYNIAKKNTDEGQYKEAEELFEQLGEYEDAKDKAKEAGELYARELLSIGNYEEAVLYYEKYNLNDENYKECCYNVALEKQKQEDFEQAFKYWEKAEGYKDSSERLIECELEKEKYDTYLLAVSKVGDGDAVAAKEILTQLPSDYKDVEELIMFCEEYKGILGKWIEYKQYFPVDRKWFSPEEVGLQPSSVIITWETGQWYVDGYTASFTNSIFKWSDGSGQLKLDVTTGEHTAKYAFHKGDSEGSKSMYKKVE